MWERSVVDGEPIKKYHQEMIDYVNGLSGNEQPKYVCRDLVEIYKKYGMDAIDASHDDVFMAFPDVVCIGEARKRNGR